MPISRMNRIPFGTANQPRSFGSYDRLEQQCLERADQEWREGKFHRVQKDARGNLRGVGGPDDDFTELHKETIVRRAVELYREHPDRGKPDKAASPYNASAAPHSRPINGRVVAYYNEDKDKGPVLLEIYDTEDDGSRSVVVDVNTGVVEGGGFRDTVYGANLDGPYRGTKHPGPQMVEVSDPTGKSGDPRFFPDAGRQREQREREARMQQRQGVSRALPDAEMTNAIPGHRAIKQVPKNESAPLLPSGRRAYGNAASFPGQDRESWRSPWRPGMDANASLRKR